MAIGQELPVVVDRADTSRLVILWEEAGTAASSPPFQYVPESSASPTVVTIGPDSRPFTTQMPGDLAARVEAALGRALSQAGPQGQALGEAIGQALSHAPGQLYGPGPGKSYGPAVGSSAAPLPGYAAPGGAVDVTLEVRRAAGSSYTTRTRLSVTTPDRMAAVPRLVRGYRCGSNPTIRPGWRSTRPAGSDSSPRGLTAAGRFRDPHAHPSR